MLTAISPSSEAGIITGGFIMSDKTEAFLHSQTRENLMRAFAGESQARNRYTIAAGVANKAGLAVIQGVFLFTAEQERSTPGSSTPLWRTAPARPSRWTAPIRWTSTPGCWTTSGPPSTTSIRSGSTTTTTSPRRP